MQAVVIGPGGVAIFIGTIDGGLFRSTDLGQTWLPVNQGLTNLNVHTVVVGPGGANLFAGTYGGMFRSADLGQTWLPVNQGLTNLDVRTVVVGPDGDSLFAGTDGGMFRSADMGQTWLPANQGLSDLFVQTVTVGPDGASLFAGTLRGGLFHSADLGQTWLPVNQGLSHLDVQTVTVGPDGASLFAGTGNGLFRSTDLGQTWQSVNQGLSNLDVQTMTIGPDGTSLFVGTGNGLFRSTDLGKTWQSVNQGLQNLTVWTVAVGPDGESLFAGTHGGLFRSTDLGQTWLPVNQGLSNLIVRPVIVGPDEASLFAGTLSGGLFRSTDLGQTWLPVNQGLSHLSVWTVSVGPDGESLFAGTLGGGLFRSTDLGQTWLPANQGLTDLDVRAVTVGPDGDSLFAGTDGGGLFRSTDLGQTWLPANQGLSHLDVTAVTVGPDGDSLFAGTFGSGLFRSTDLGQTWLPANQGLTDLDVSAVTVGPDGDSLFAGTFGSGLFRSTDLGQTWLPVNQGLSHLDVWDVSVGPDGDSLFAGTFGGGLFRSTDLGQTWLPVNHGLSSLGIIKVSIGPDEASLFVSAISDGLFRSTDGGQTWLPVNHGLTSLGVVTLTVGSDKQSLFARTVDGGLFRSKDLGKTWQSVHGSDMPQFSPSSEIRLQQLGSRLHLSRPGMAYGLPWTDTFSENVALIINEEQQTATLVTLAGAAQLIRQEITLPRIWKLPTPYLNLVAASWQGIYWLRINRVPLLLTLSFSLSLFLVYMYSGVVRPNRLSLRLTLWLLPRPQHLFAAAAYQDYKMKWLSLPPLECFIWLFARQHPIVEPRLIVPDLRQAGVSADEEDVELALTALARQGTLYQGEGKWKLTNLLLADILVRDLPSDTLTHLVKTLRQQNALYAETQRFLAAASFTLAPHGEFGFVAQSNHPMWQSRQPRFYVQVVPDRALDIDVVQEILQVVPSTSEQRNSHVVLAAIDRPPKTSDLYQIFATRAQTGLTIVPLPLSFMRQARLEGDALTPLNKQINQYTGQEDMYDVKTAVSDVLSFFGRQSQLTTLQKRLTLGHSVMAFGVRKIGKSSLMHRLREACAWPTAIIDAQGFTGGLQYVFEEAVQQWRAAIQVDYPRLTLPAPPAHDAAAGDLGGQVQAFRQAASDLLALLGAQPQQPGLLLFVDEMEYLYENQADVFFSVASVLRSLAEHVQWRGRFAILAAGLDPILNRTDYLADYRNPFFAFFEEAAVGPLAQDDARSMILSLGGQMGISYAEEALTYLATTGGGHPFLTRQLCHYAIRNRTERPLLIDMAAAQESVHRYLREPTNYLARSLWYSEGDSGPAEQEAAILQMLAVQPHSLEAELIPPDMPAAPKQQRQLALFRLRDQSLVQQDAQSQQWSLTIPLYRRWIRRAILNLADDFDET